MSAARGVAAAREAEARAALLAAAGECARRGLNEGAAGNLSLRLGEGFLVTPSGVPPEALAPESMVPMALDGRVLAPVGRPSSEWRFHRDIYLARPEAGAVVHVHSPHATALACTRRGLPAFHYMVALAGGADVRCAPYATFGSQALSDHALRALDGRKACLLANHGMIALGAHLAEALYIACEVENLARQYALSLALGGPVLLEAEEMQRVLEKFEHYGPHRQEDPTES